MLLRSSIDPLERQIVDAIDLLAESARIIAATIVSEAREGRIKRMISGDSLLTIVHRFRSIKPV
jgi:hypothetical protein